MPYPRFEFLTDPGEGSAVVPGCLLLIRPLERERLLIYRLEAQDDEFIEGGCGELHKPPLSFVGFVYRVRVLLPISSERSRALVGPAVWRTVIQSDQVRG